MVGSRAGSDIGYRRIVGVALLRRVIFFIRKVIPFELNEVLIAVSFNRLAVLFKLNLIIGTLAGIGLLTEDENLRSVREEGKNLCAICRSIITDVDTVVGRLVVAYDAGFNPVVEILLAGRRSAL